MNFNKICSQFTDKSIIFWKSYTLKMPFIAHVVTSDGELVSRKLRKNEWAISVKFSKNADTPVFRK